MSVLANNLSEDDDLEIHMILLTKSEKFFELSDKVAVHEPGFDYKTSLRIVSLFKTFHYLRRLLVEFKPYSIGRGSLASIIFL